MAWTIEAVGLPAGEPVVMWVDDRGHVSEAPIDGAEVLPGRFVLHGLVDSHAHPTTEATASGPAARGAASSLELLASWAASGVSLVRDVGSPGGRILDLTLPSGLPRLQMAGRFLAKEGQYFPGLLVEGVAESSLVAAALAEVARGAQWVKVIGDFPAVIDGRPTPPVLQMYSLTAVAALVTAVHAAGARVAVHCTDGSARALVEMGVDSIEHGTGIDAETLELMAARGVAWTPTLCASIGLPGRSHPKDDDYRERLRELLPLAVRLGVPVLTGSDVAGSVPQEIALLASLELDPAAALAAATTAAYAFLGETFEAAGSLTSMVTYDDDPRQDLEVLERPAAVLIDGVRVR